MAAASTPSIVHVVEHMAPGGIETLVLDMVRETPGRHTIISLQGSAESLVAAWPALAAEKNRLVGLGREGGFDPSLILRLRTHLRRVGATSVIAHHIGPLVYGGFAARAAGIRTVVHVEHDAWHYQDASRRRLAKMLFALVRPERVAVSREIAERIAAWDPGARLTVIPPGIDMRRFHRQDRARARDLLGLPQTAAVIGTAGRLVEVKGQKFLIEALATINRERASRGRAPAHLVIAGDGPEREALAALALARGVHGEAMLLGHRDNLPDILPAFDVFALPSLNEGLPRSVLEAQATGLPVVASDVGDLKSAVCPVTGRLVRPADSGALAQALTEVLDRPSGSVEARRFVEDRFSLTATLAAYARLISVPTAP